MWLTNFFMNWIFKREHCLLRNNNGSYKRNVSSLISGILKLSDWKTLRLSIPAQNGEGVFVIFSLPALISKHMQ